MKYDLFGVSLLIATAVLITAAFLQTDGFAASVALLSAGIGFEIWFWVRLVRRRRLSQVARPS